MLISNVVVQHYYTSSEDENELLSDEPGEHSIQPELEVETLDAACLISSLVQKFMGTGSVGTSSIAVKCMGVCGG